jgi:hypothetical protein
MNTFWSGFLAKKAIKGLIKIAAVEMTRKKMTAITRERFILIDTNSACIFCQ